MKRSTVALGQAVVDPAPSETSGWLVDHSKNRFTIHIVQFGSGVSAYFARWDAAINFDPGNLETSRVEFRIDISSLSLGGVSEQAIFSDFLNAAAYTVATFMLNRFVKVRENAYEDHRQLSMVGERRPLVLPFTLKIENDRAVFEGVVTIRRLDFSIGSRGFPKDGMVGFSVLLNVTLAAEKAPSPSD
ncbi:MAG: YceI family protein [Alphaproteobacteria bacterium]|nr:YceI family protein [Alphaproteobacteria bacterium]